MTRARCTWPATWTGLTVYSHQLTLGQVPAAPFVILGQNSTADPTRSPAGTESAWGYTHVPLHPRGDAGGRAARRLVGPGRPRALRGADRAPGGPVRAGIPGPRRRPARPVLPGTCSIPTRTSPAVRSTVAARDCTSSSCSGRRPGRAAPRPRSSGSTWPPPPPTRAAACAGARARTPPGRRCAPAPPVGSRWPRPAPWSAGRRAAHGPPPAMTPGTQWTTRQRWRGPDRRARSPVGVHSGPSLR